MSQKRTHTRTKVGEKMKPALIINKDNFVKELLDDACHFRPSNEDVSACGVEQPKYSAYDGRDVDCVRCQKTNKWKTYMGK